MTTLTVTARGQITLGKNVLQHLGIKEGQKIELDFLPGGMVALKSAKQNRTIQDFVGLLSGRTTKIASIEELNEASSQAWAATK